jgi:hypothetical protein
MWPISAFLSRIVKASIFIAAIYLFRADFIKEGVVQIGAITAMYHIQTVLGAKFNDRDDYNQLMAL